MKYIILAVIVLFFTSPAAAANIPDLADCSVKIFTEISKEGIWSGSPPAECKTQVQVEKRQEELFITIWIVEQEKSGWMRTAFSSAMSKAELKPESKSRWPVANAGAEIIARAGHLEQCLESANKKDNSVIECLHYESESYLAGKHGGTEHKLKIWLDDSRHHTKAEIAYGDTDTHTPPADLFDGKIIPPGGRIDWYRAEIKPSGDAVPVDPANSNIKRGEHVP